MTVTGLLDAVELVSHGIYVVLGLVALRLWITDRSRGAGYVAAAFASLAGVVLIARVLPADDPPRLLLQVVILAILVMPWLLVRFVGTLEPTPRWVRVGSDGAVLLLGAWTFLLGDFPAADEPTTGIFAAYTMAFLAYWVGATVRVGWRLWRAGREQPGVIRSRLRLLAGGSVGLALALLLPVGTPTDTRTLIGAIAGVLAGLFFLVGFAPPRLLRQRWREPEEVELRDATSRLMLATTHDDVARTVLPSMVGLMGADAGAIIAADGRVRTSDGVSSEEAATLLEAEGEFVIHLELARGDSLVLRTSSYAPMFGRDEREMLDRLVGLVDLALDRAALLSSERDARRDAERANREVEAFVATITHDLRNPLTAIVGMCDLLTGPLAEDLSERATGFVARIAANADYMTGMVRDILDLAEINSTSSNPEPVDLTIVAGVVREELVMRAPTSDVVVGALPTILADPTHVRRLFENIVNNAIKHAGRPDVKVTVTATQREDVLDLSFQDNGVGIPADAAERVFGLFQQLEGSEGSGLGLAICRKLVENLGGRVWFEPSDVGADLRVQLPASIIVRQPEGAPRKTSEKVARWQT